MRISQQWASGGETGRVRTGNKSYLSACRVRRCARLVTTPAHRVLAHVVAQALMAVSKAGVWLRH
eukprot:3275053-Prymnesium_polylepis.1